MIYDGRTVKLLDGSTIQQEGKSQKGGETVRIHMCYNITEGRMACVLATDKHTAESVSVFTIESEAYI